MDDVQNGHMECKPVVTYCRVSTERQGQSSLGLETECERRSTFVTQNGMEITSSSTETEIGKGFDAVDRQPQLATALSAVKRL